MSAYDRATPEQREVVDAYMRGVTDGVEGIVTLRGLDRGPVPRNDETDEPNPVEVLIAGMLLEHLEGYDVPSDVQRMLQNEIAHELATARVDALKGYNT